MTAGRNTEPEIFAAVAESLVERIFGAVSALRQLVLERRLLAVVQREQLQSRHIAELRPGLIDLLGQHRDIVVGMGLIVAAGLLPKERRRLEWWQYAPGREQPSALQVDLNPESLGFYDCDSAEWFCVPRRTGRRHIVGPYVDAHGTDRYLLTFTTPVAGDGTFLGVVGADVAVSRFERHLLGAWGQIGTGGWVGQIGTGGRVGQIGTGGRVGQILPAGGVGDPGADVLIVNSQGRVVVSNCARALSGDLVDADALPPTAVRLDLPDVPWQLLLSRNRLFERRAAERPR